MAEKILLTGSGLVARRLAQRLLSKGYDVYFLSRKLRDGRTFLWDPERGTIAPQALKGVDYIIHLAGADIAAERWTVERKKEIIASRIDTAELLGDMLQKHQIQLKAFISASAVGYYGAQTAEHIFQESDPAGNDFLATVCTQWEQVAYTFSPALAQRVACVRIGLVLAPHEGLLARLVPLVRSYLGSTLGTGRQYMPWIHIDDLCGIIHHLLCSPNLQGSFNAVAPHPVVQSEFMRTLARSLHRPIIAPPVPVWLLRWLLGERACLVLEGSRADAAKIQASGFLFQYPNLSDALADLWASSKAQKKTL